MTRLAPFPDGLGWPGRWNSIASLACLADPHFILSVGKGTLARLNATDSECKTREETMAAAIRTILECIGEDPDRQGLLKTPERYAKALLWMTRGYEEKLSGRCCHEDGPTVY